MNQQNNRVWSAPEEVPASELRSGRIIAQAKHAFAVDVRLRLEQTKLPHAIRYRFLGEAEAKTYRDYASGVVRSDLGHGVMRSAVKRDGDGCWYVYFARGPKYGNERGSYKRQ